MTTELPSWLELTQTTSASPESPTVTTATPPAPAEKPSGKELTYEELQFENFLEGAMERLVQGHPLKDIVNDDPRNLSYGKLLYWIHKDPKRQQRYYEARTIGAEAVADEMIGISDGTDNPLEDVTRSKQRLDTRWRLLGVWNRKRFGGDTTVGGGGGNQPITINIGEVVSPYAKQAVEMVETPVVEINDVEVKE